MLDHVQRGAERAGKDWRDIEIVNRAMVLVTADKAAARDKFRAAFSPYYATLVYNQFLAWAGYADAASGVASGWSAKDRVQTASALSDDLVDQIAIIGSADECRARIKAGMLAGIHTQIIAPLAGASDAETEATFAAFASGEFELPATA
jgi:alkanesulfonate monooxygenase SsuD/methylene tetrahydromethanopterin reductase-like flavin-dependent oxidoreductase (luciferase family)